MGERDVIKLMMVDDEPALFHGVKRSLENTRFFFSELNTEATFEYMWVSSGEEFFEALKSSSPELVFLDYKLPQMSGIDVLNKLKQDNNTALVVMITAFANLETAVKATKLGTFDFLSKPFTPDEIRYVARKAAQQVILTRRARMIDEEKKKIRFEFLSVLAHELKAPLNAVEGYLDILKDRLEGQNLQMIERSLIRLDGARKLIFDLLDLTRIESGMKKREIADTDVMKIIEHVLDGLELDILQKKLSVFKPSNTSFIAKVDPQEFEIIASNLLSNAVKYNKPEGFLEIILERKQNSLTFKVRDGGIGLSDEESKKLFQEFMRIRNEKTQNILGSGLGLSTVKKLARLYEGDVTLESEPDKGSTFSICLQNV